MTDYSTVAFIRWNVLFYIIMRIIRTFFLNQLIFCSVVFITIQHLINYPLCCWCFVYFLFFCFLFLLFTLLQTLLAPRYGCYDFLWMLKIVVFWWNNRSWNYQRLIIKLQNDKRRLQQIDKIKILILNQLINLHRFLDTLLIWFD